jgi:predicted MPP superfamily phosphohydrolase
MGMTDVDFTVAFLPDVHLEGTEEPSDAWKVAKTFVMYQQPSEIILGGDFLEMSCLSHWLAKKRLLLEGKRYKADVALANKEITDLEKRCPEAKITYLEGNHEDWLTRYIESHPEMQGVIDLQTDLHLAERGIEWVPFNDVYTVGHMNYIHGWYWNIYHARKHLNRMGSNVMYGHVHQYQVESMRLRAKSQIYTAMATGCLCNLNPAWKRNRPNDWMHGFGFVEYRKDGTFQPHHLVVVDGAISFGGKTFTK